MSNYKEDKLLPCPFCGSDFKDRSYDRGQVFACNPCGYSRWFPGLLTTVKNDVPIPYVDDDKKPIPPEDVKHQEYYHLENVAKAIDAMNTRHEIK